MKTLIVALLLSVGVIASDHFSHTGNMVASRQVTPSKLLQASDLTYLGAFRMTTGYQTKGWDYGGQALAYNPAKGTLMAVTMVNDAAEFSIPALVPSTTVGGLARATVVQAYTDPLAGHKNDLGTVWIGGLLPLADRLIVSVAVYYDAAPPFFNFSHFRTGLNFANPGTVVGPVQVGPPNTGAFVGGYMTPIPPEWQGPLGGPALTGQCCLAIISRTSYGPSVSVFDPAQVGAITPVPATRLLSYPAQHPTLGGWDTNTALFNGATTVAGVVFPGGSRSILFFGRLGTRFCYGSATTNQALDGTLSPDGVNKFCFDPVDGGKGTHGYPYRQFVWAYSADDLVAVKSGAKQPWEIQPYSTWELHTPFETLRSQIVGATYDPASHRLFLSVGYEDGNSPLVEVFSVNVAASVPAPVPVACVVTSWGAWSPWTANAIDETRIRLPLAMTPPANGGAVCPASEIEHRPLCVLDLTKLVSVMANQTAFVLTDSAGCARTIVR